MIQSKEVRRLEFRFLNFSCLHFLHGTFDEGSGAIFIFGLGLIKKDYVSCPSKCRYTYSGECCEGIDAGYTLYLPVHISGPFFE